jgi:hypothetical protein
MTRPYPVRCDKPRPGDLILPRSGRLFLSPAIAASRALPCGVRRCGRWPTSRGAPAGHLATER